MWCDGAATRILTSALNGGIYTMMKKVNITLWILLSVYLSVVFYFTVVSREPSGDCKLELLPFNTIVEFFNVPYHSHGRYILREVLVNIGLLMPFAFLLGHPSFLPGTGVRFRKVVFLGFLTSLTIETLQLITKTGTFEVDDLIYNTLGCAIGYRICTSSLLKARK